MARPTLDPIEVRVAGALAEKALATPDQYPLSLNALVAACNQKTAREPVTDYSERDVTAAIERLSRRGLIGTSSGSGHRVAKFRHNLDRALDLSHRELVALALLMLRGPQTPGKIRSRSGRMEEFTSVADVEEALWLLEDRDEPLAVKLPRAPGQAADRYAHALSGPPADEVAAEVSSPASVPPPRRAENGPPALLERVETLEAEVERLRAEMEAFRAQFE